MSTLMNQTGVPLFVPTAFTTNQKHSRSSFSPSICVKSNPQGRAQHVKVIKWRCSAKERAKSADDHTRNQTGEKGDDNLVVIDSEAAAGTNVDEGEDKDVDNSFQLDSLDEQFNDVLSKDWDALMSFDPENFSPPDQIEPDVKKADEIASANEDSEDGENNSTANDEGNLGDEKRKTKVTKADLLNKNEKKGILLKNNEEDDRDDNPRWYFVQVKPGCEKHVAKSFRNLSKALLMDDLVDVFVPTKTATLVSKGGKVTYKDERYFPGYILVLMAMNRYSYGHIVRVTNVQGFMGDSNRESDKTGPFRCPPPISDKEMRDIYEKLRTPDDITTVPKSEDFSKPKPEAEKSEKMKERKQRGRSRINALLSNSDIDYKQAATASAADDLAAILSEDTDESWDPFAGETSKRKRRTLPNQSFKSEELEQGNDGFADAEVEMEDDDGFASVEMAEDGDDNENTDFKSEKQQKNDVYSDDPLDFFDDPGKGLPGSDNKSDEGDADDDLFAWLDEKDPFPTDTVQEKAPTKRMPEKGFSEEELDSLLSGDESDDIWNRKEEEKTEEEDSGLDALLAGGKIDDIWDAKDEEEPVKS